MESSNTLKGQEPRPVAIWRTLVKQAKVPTQDIAICTSTKELPKDAARVSSIDQLSDTYPHIIFNKKLQEGWDDPSVYLCYFDGETRVPRPAFSKSWDGPFVSRVQSTSMMRN